MSNNSLTIAVASGKGGTGKTTVATNLALAVARSAVNVVYADCDVEEPNGHIFMRPEIEESREAAMQFPEVNEETCISCGKCGEICQFKAIVMIGEKPLVMPEMCHDCDGCKVVCPVGAVSMKDRRIGIVERGMSEAVTFIHGILDIGQVMSPPLIRAVRRAVPGGCVAIVDSPPGTSCPVIESIRGADYAILVTEPTPFGLHDLKLAVEMLEELKIPHGVVINRSDVGTGETKTFCERRSIGILAEIPDDRRIAEAYSRGEMIVDVIPEYTGLFNGIFEKLKRKL